MENFNAPYFSSSVSEFWRKWHISLTSWFKDYLYIPLGGGRKGKFRKYINKLIVFLVSGLWHGASISFLMWGGLNGIYQITGEILQPAKDKIVKFFHLHKDTLGYKVMQVVITFILIDFSWIFFRADSGKTSFKIIKAIFDTNNPWILLDGSIYKCGLDIKNFWLMIYGIILLLAVDFCKTRKIVIREIICRQDIWVRWLVIDAAIIVILVFGIWGSTYDAANFIYFQF